MNRNDSGEVHPVLIVAGLVVLALLLSVGGFLLKVALSGPIGRGNAHIEKESSTNRIGQNSVFFDLKTDYDATVGKVPVYAEQAKTGDPVAKVNFSGLQSHCLDVVGQYAAQSGKYISKDFKDAGLPESLDPSACRG